MSTPDRRDTRLCDNRRQRVCHRHNPPRETRRRRVKRDVADAEARNLLTAIAAPCSDGYFVNGPLTPISHAPSPRSTSR
jgi:hypothetical protein